MRLRSQRRVPRVNQVVSIHRAQPAGRIVTWAGRPAQEAIDAIGRIGAGLDIVAGHDIVKRAALGFCQCVQGRVDVAQAGLFDGAGGYQVLIEQRYDAGHAGCGTRCAADPDRARRPKRVVARVHIEGIMVVGGRRGKIGHVPHSVVQPEVVLPWRLCEVNAGAAATTADGTEHRAVVPYRFGNVAVSRATGPIVAASFIELCASHRSNFGKRTRRIHRQPALGQ